MILDTGICAVYRVDPVPGGGLKRGLTLKFETWYGALRFENTPRTEAGQVIIETAGRIRIPQNRAVSAQDIVKMDGVRYGIARVYHGADDDGGALISDITLENLAVDDDFTEL